MHHATTPLEALVSPLGAAPAPPGGRSDEHLRWLVDRLQVSDLLNRSTRALDDRDWDAYGRTYVEDAAFEIGDEVRIVGRSRIQAVTRSRHALGGYAGTWHLTSNHEVRIDGDTALLRACVMVVHMRGGGTRDHADGAGWYDCTARRTADGWLFDTVRITEVWHGGADLSHAPPPISRARY